MLNPRSVLVADDEPAIRSLVAAHLVRAGYRAEVAEDGDQALASFERRSFDAAIIDLIMPGKEGIETMLAIKRRWPGCKVVVMSGGGRIGAGEVLGLARALGADAVLPKPFTAADVLSALEGLLYDRSQAA